MVRRHHLLWLLVTALLSGACGGPETPLKLGFKEVPSDVVLGDQSRDPQSSLVDSPPADRQLQELPPSIVALPPPPFSPRGRTPRPSPPVPECPSADPLAAPAIEAPAAIEAPPSDGQYLFRNDGRFEVSGANARRGRFPATSLRTVKVLFRSDDGAVFDFSVAELLGDVTTTTTYRVVRTTGLGTAAEGAPEPGVYIRQVESARPGEAPASFTPTPSLQLAALPLVRGAQVQARGVDPTTATTMSFTSTVSGKARVDACGEPLDSFTLELTDGTLLGPDEDLQFAATYAVGTQFGGLILRDTVAFAGTDGGEGVSRTNTATISQVP